MTIYNSRWRSIVLAKQHNPYNDMDSTDWLIPCRYVPFDALAII